MSLVVEYFHMNYYTIPLSVIISPRHFKKDVLFKSTTFIKQQLSNSLGWIGKLQTASDNLYGASEKEFSDLTNSRFMSAAFERELFDAASHWFHRETMILRHRISELILGKTGLLNKIIISDVPNWSYYFTIRWFRNIFQLFRIVYLSHRPSYPKRYETVL